MDNTDLGLLRQQLMRHEGLRLTPYTDTMGKLTIGYGHNLTAKGITTEVADLLLTADIDDTLAQVTLCMPWFRNLDPIRQRALADMAFNIGVRGLLGFKRMLNAVNANRWEDAANEMENSTWAKQVGKRALELSQMMQTGKDVFSVVQCSS